MKNKFIRFFWTTPIGIITGIPALLGLLFLLIMSILANQQSNSIHIEQILISLSFLSFGCMGIPMVIRQEAPGIIPNGKFAVIYGVILIFFSLFVSLSILVLIILNY